jgi:hypothetical protein
MIGVGEGYDPPVATDGGSYDPDGGDPFEGLTLDEDFIRGAPIREPAATERERAARQANLSRLLADDAAQRENRAHAYRRQVSTWEDEELQADWYPAGTRRRRRGRIRAIGLLVVVAMVAAYVVADYLRVAPTTGSSTATDDRRSADRGTATATGPEAISAAGRPDNWPSRRTDASTVPLGTPGAVPGGGGPHTFVDLQKDGVTPVGYDPCRPVTFVTREGGPDAGGQMVREAVAMVAAASGLQFVDEGTTPEPPSDDRPAYQPERYGDRWAPVLIAWSNAEESPRLGRMGEPGTADADADVAGYAGSRSVGLAVTDPATGSRTETGFVYVTGSVVLDTEDLTRLLGEPDGYARARAIVAHELAHLVGLGHVDDPAQLMHPTGRAEVTGFGPGDLEGLARLGTLDCFADI